MRIGLFCLRARNLVWDGQKIGSALVVRSLEAPFAVFLTTVRVKAEVIAFQHPI